MRQVVDGLRSLKAQMGARKPENPERSRREEAPFVHVCGRAERISRPGFETKFTRFGCFFVGYTGVTYLVLQGVS